MNKYARTPKDATLKPFDWFEVHGCKEYDKGSENAFVEQVDDSEAEFWSLYGHIPEQGLECIGDFKTREAAERIQWQIENWKTTD